jgi:hypothetical protein
VNLAKKTQSLCPLLALVISLSFRWAIQLAIFIAVLAFELKRLVVLFSILRLCVHHVPSAGDRRVFANGSICITSFRPAAAILIAR